MQKLTIFLLFFYFNFSFGQNKRDSILDYYNEISRKELNLRDFKDIKFDKFYRIWISDYQVVELIKFNDSIYEGNLINSVTRVFKKKKDEKVIQVIKIPEKIVNKLMLELNLKNIEVLRDCYEFENYPKGFDGKSYTFEIGINDKVVIYSYWEPESFKDLEIDDLKSVQQILKSINNEFNLWDYFIKFRERLPKGFYSYGGVNIQVLN